MSQQTLLPAERPVVAIERSQDPTVMEVIRELAVDERVNVETLAGLIQLKEREEARIAEREFNRDFAAAMSEMPTIGKLGTKDMGDKGKIPYARYEDIDRAIRPIEARHGFARSFRTSPGEGGILLTLVLTHRGGHSITSTRLMPPDPGPGRNAIQAQGSGESYGRRYATLSVWNLVTENIDDDAHAAGWITERQADTIEDLIAQCGTANEPADVVRAGFLRYMGAKLVSEIHARDFQKAITALESKRRKVGN